MAIILKRLFSYWALSLGAGALISFALFRPWEKDMTEWDWVENGLLFIGMGLLFKGFRYLRSVYTYVPGIRINPNWVTILNDAIAFLFSTGAALMAIDFLLQKYLDCPSIIDDEFLQLMGIFFMLTGVPILAFYISRLTSQSLEISKKGINFHNLDDSTSIKWDQIEKVSLSNEYVMVGRVGTLVPRKLQKRLKIELSNQETLFINEPQIKARKNRIIKELKLYGPTQILDLMKTPLDNW